MEKTNIIPYLRKLGSTCSIFLINIALICDECFTAVEEMSLEHKYVPLKVVFVVIVKNSSSPPTVGQLSAG